MRSNLSSRHSSECVSAVVFNSYALHAIEGSKPGDLDIVVARSFHASLQGFSSSISAIIVDASTASSSLDALAEHLSTVYALSLQESLDTAFALEDLLWELWTVLGGNKDKLRDLSTRATLLRSVQEYRATASAYIAATIQTLSSLNADLTELRERVGASYEGSDPTPLEVQIASIERSIRRMTTSSSSHQKGSSREEVTTLG